MREINLEKFGAFISEKRKALGMTQKAISLSENPTARGNRFHKKNLPVWLAYAAKKYE